MTLPSSDWESSDGLYMQTIFVNGITGNMYLYIATEDETNLKLVYKHRIEVDTFDSNEVTFIAESQPASDVDLILLVEDFIFPNIEGADLELSFDDDAGTLSASWSSPDDFSKFITWSQDRIEIEKYDEDSDEWVYVYDYTEYGENAYVDEPLIIGGS